ncbi:MAG: YbhB/YbcL family Raf kinase inhibitor-like protein [Thaumarchaeota archaeon]|nr:YbhB/YbcL family Raf kinase inhibitor-like protein [Nitrososphaerota archaeon]
MLVRENAAQTGHSQAFVLSSTAFEYNGTIPLQYTCDGSGISPPLAISGISQTAKSLALTVVDVDAPNGPFTHWTVWNIPTNVTAFYAGEDITFPQGITSAGTHGYKGPCPPSGTHRYFFTAYALDAVLDLNQNATRGDLEQAMNGHVIDRTELMGKYSKG